MRAIQKAGGGDQLLERLHMSGTTVIHKFVPRQFGVCNRRAKLSSWPSGSVI